MDHLHSTGEYVKASLVAPDAESLYRLCIIMVLGLVVVYALCGHVIEKHKILLVHESTVGVLTGIFVQWLLIG